MKKTAVTFCGATRWLTLSVLCLGVVACSATTEKKKTKSKEYFPESEYGVKASPRVVADGSEVPKGGGRYMLGKPYTVRGKKYVPQHNPDYKAEGLASWYGSAFHGRQTANGEVYDQYHLSAAHPTMPLPSYARVTNMDNGSSVLVRVNDRGPFHRGRIIDVSEKTAELLDMKRNGTARVRVEYVGPARMDGHDMPFLMASYSPKGDRLPQVMPDGIGGPGIMVASADPAPTAIPVPMPNPAINEFPPAPSAPGADAASMTSENLPAANGAVTATAFGTVDAGGAGTEAFPQFILLPETGPMLIERPANEFVAKRSGTLSSAYVSVGEPASALAFDAILVRDDRLTEAAIQAYAKRRASDD
jgi:rare lipoprotein A